MTTIREPKIYNNFSGGYSCENAVFNSKIQQFVKDTKNIDIIPLEENGFGFEKTAGNTQLFQIVDESIINLFTYQGSGEEYLIINTDAGKVYEYNEATGNTTAIKTGLTVTANKSSFANISIAPIGSTPRPLGFFCNGVDVPFTYEKGASPEIQDVIAVGVDGRTIKSFIAVTYDNRIFLADSNILYWSKYKDPWNFSEASSGAVNAGYEPFDSEIKAVKVYSTGLAIHTANGLKFGTPNGTGGYSFTTLSSNSAISYKAAVNHDSSSFMFSKEGVFPIEVIQEGVRKVSSSVSYPILKDLQYLDSLTAFKTELIDVTVSGRNETWLHVPLSSYPNNSVIYALRWKTGYLKDSYWLPPRIQQKINCLHVFKDYILSGTPDGKVLKEFEGNTFDGETIDFYAKTPEIVLGTASGKQETVPYAFISSSKNIKFTYGYILNGDSKSLKEYDIAKNNSGSLVWGASDWGENWATVAMNTIKMKKAKSKGKRQKCSLQMIFRNKNTDDDLSVSRLEFTKVKVTVK